MTTFVESDWDDSSARSSMANAGSEAVGCLNLDRGD